MRIIWFETQRPRLYMGRVGWISQVYCVSLILYNYVCAVDVSQSAYSLMFDSAQITAYLCEM